jgi:hypothetical protein
MEHLQRDHLALRALGEPVGSTLEDTHLRACEICRRELAEFQDIADLARDLDEHERALPEPPPDLWDRIATELRSTPDTAVTGETVPEVADLRQRRATRPRRRWSLVAAAAAIALVAVVGVSVVTGVGEEQAALGVATLEPLDDRAAAAQARLVEEDGEMVLRLDGGSLPDADGYYEVWLIDADVVGMVSLGPLDADRGHRLPADLDPASFPIVDVSLEPLDGDPTHSGDSLLRGELELDV